jgi:hypothetical protein
MDGLRTNVLATTRARGTRMTSTHRTAAVAAAAAIALTACGGSSKPGYCSDRTDLENSIKAIGDVKPGSGAVDQLKSKLQTVESNAQQLVSSAKSDFPSETSAISTSVNKLKADVQKLSSSPNPKQVALLGADAKAVVTAAQDFHSASQSKCK